MTIIIDSTTYDVPMTILDETADFLYKYAERTEDGKLHSELIGIYFNYKIKFGSPAETTELAALWLKLSEPVETHTITLPDANGVPRTFPCYFSGLSRSLRKYYTAQTFWKDMAVNVISIDPSRVPV
jgi:hypothetical protein